MTGLTSELNKSTQNTPNTIERGLVLSTAETDSNLTDHTVKVVTASSGQFEAEVLVRSGGDFYLPPVDSVVTVAFYPDDTPAIIGSKYKDLDIERLAGGERRIGHEGSDSHILLENNGDITITLDDNSTVTLSDGVLSIDGGTTPVVTEVDTTKDADGYVTSVDAVTNKSILL